MPYFTYIRLILCILDLLHAKPRDSLQYHNNIMELVDSISRDDPDMPYT